MNKQGTKKIYKVVFKTCLCLSFWLVLLFSSCRPDPLDVKEMPLVKPEIVVASQVVSKEGLVISLTKTIGALQASEDSDVEDLLHQIAVNDATVVLSGPTSIDTLLFYENGFYASYDIQFVSGATYDLYVNSESLGSVSASTTLKPQILFTDIEAELYYNDYDDTLAYIAYSLVDPPGNNWYMINVQKVEQVDLDEDLINPRAFTLLLQDSAFNGEEHLGQFLAYPTDYAPGDTVAVSLSNISEEYYDFMKLRRDNRYSFIEFIGEPIDYPSNVIDGRGFFNLYIPDVRTFVME